MQMSGKLVADSANKYFSLFIQLIFRIFVRIKQNLYG